VSPTLSLKLDDEITIRRAETIADYRACQEVQRRAWGIMEEGYVIPVATMVGANLHGGLVLGAFLAGGGAAALSFAFLGRVEGRLCLYSQLTGVVPGYQSRGLGYEMKKLQRAIARSEGIELIVWAFDPLQAGNAHFNLARLGATAYRYIENMYGERTDSLNSGVPTDSLIAEWETGDTPVVAIAAAEVRVLPRLIDAGQGGTGRPGRIARQDVGQAFQPDAGVGQAFQPDAGVGQAFQPDGGGQSFQPDVRLESLTYDTRSSAVSRGDRENDSSAPHPRFLGVPTVGVPRLLLEIPHDISRLRRESPALAESWRLVVNLAFRASFAAGYRAVSFVREESSRDRRHLYVLDRI